MSTRASITPGYGAILVALIALVVYLPALGNGFAFDDVVLIPGDARVTEGQIGTLLTSSYWREQSLSLYRPLTSLSFAFDWFAGRGSPAWFHFMNIAWHIAASLLVYALLLRYFALAAALVAAAVFAAHPVHVEAVANTVGRGELIATTLVLAACLIWTRVQARSARIVLGTALYFLAMCAKEGAAVLPALLVLIDFADGEWSPRTAGGYLRRRAPELAALILSFALFVFIRLSILDTLAPARVDPSLEIVTSGWHRILTALQAWPVALKLLVFPSVLLADYGPRILMPIAEWNTLAVLGATMIIALVGGGAAALFAGQRTAALALLWYPVAILPVSNFLLPIGVVFAERVLYLPSVAFSFAVAGLFTLLHQRVTARSLVTALAVVIVLALGIRSLVRAPEWDSTDRIMMALVRDRPDSFRGQWHAARMARAQNLVPKAVEKYSEAVTLWPYREGLMQEAAAYATGAGYHAFARDVATFGARRWPQNVMFHRFAAANALDMGDTAAARVAARRGLDIHPADTMLTDLWQAIHPAEP